MRSVLLFAGCDGIHVFGSTCVWEHSGEGENPADEASNPEKQVS